MGSTCAIPSYNPPDQDYTIPKASLKPLPVYYSQPKTEEVIMEQVESAQKSPPATTTEKNQEEDTMKQPEVSAQDESPLPAATTKSTPPDDSLPAATTESTPPDDSMPAASNESSSTGVRE